MQLAYSYIRFSSARQELGDSLRRQLKLAEDYANEHNLSLDHSTYRDLGLSAFKGRHAVDGNLGLFLKAVEEKRISPGSFLLVESLDRLSRQQVDEALELFLSIIRRGITIVTLLDKQIYSRERIKEDRGISLIISITYMMRAHEESSTKSQRIRQVWDAKVKSGKILTSVCPSWLSLNDEKTGWCERPEVVEVVRSIFQMALDGMGTPTIAKHLNATNIPTMGRSKRWVPELVMLILKNKAVIGTFTSPRTKMDPIPNYYPTIVEVEVFHKVQELVASRRGTGGRKGATVSNLFSGLLRCECGSKMRYVAGVSPNVYLHCLNAYSNLGCDAPRIPYAPLEAKLLFWICNFEGMDLGLSKTVSDPTVVVRGELEDKRKRMDALVEAVATRDSPLPSLMTAIEKLEIEIKGLESELRDYKVPTPAGEAGQATMEAYRKLDTTTGPELAAVRLQLQASLRRIITKIVALKTLHQNDRDEDYRNMVVYGPICDILKDTEYWELWEKTEDGGIVQDYPLPLWGTKGLRRRKVAARKKR